MIRGALCDLSGVIYVGSRAVPGAIDALDRLRDRGVPTRFLTNVTRTPSREILQGLKKMGFSITAADLFTAPLAAREYLWARKLRPFLLVHPKLLSEFAELRKDSPNAVLVGDAGHEFTYENMNRAFRSLLDGGPLLAMGDNRYFKEADGLSLDIGPFVAALEYATGNQAIILGKPAPAFFEGALLSLGCAADEVVMIGDDVLTDVEGALAAGLKGILVRTGKYRPGDEDQITHPGAMVVEDIQAAVDWILTQTD